MLFPRYFHTNASRMAKKYYMENKILVLYSVDCVAKQSKRIVFVGLI